MQIRVNGPVIYQFIRAKPMQTKSTATLCPNIIMCQHSNPGNDAQKLLPILMHVRRKVVYA